MTERAAAARQAEPPHRAAIAAWKLVAAGSAAPRSIVPLAASQKSTVWLLQGAGPDGGPVIAKRGAARSIAVEREVYQALGDALPPAGLRCYGSLADRDEEWAWIFVDGANGVPFSSDLAPHRAVAGRWLGRVHAEGSSLGALARTLPDRGPDFYRGHCESGRERCRLHLNNPSLRSEDREVLHRILERLDLLIERWQSVEEACALTPPTLVHGDFFVQNARVRGSPPHSTLLIFDWENAGWGTPAIDLLQRTDGAISPDLDAYWDAVRGAWPGVRRNDIDLLAALAQLFWATLCISWESWELEYRWVVEAMECMRIYERRFIRAREALGW